MMMTELQHQAATSLVSLLAGLASLPAAMAPLAVTSVTQDSREVKPGGLFIARAGLHSHGLDYLDQIVAQGAIAVVAEIDQRWSAERIAGAMSQYPTESPIAIVVIADMAVAAATIAARFYQDPSAQLDVIGVTGTNGKSSCSWLLAHALNTHKHACMIGTLGNGAPGALSHATHTTPDVVSLHGLLAEMRATGCTAVAMEVSSHALTQARVAGIHFDIGVFTNLSRDHLDYHGTMQAYGAAKAKLFQLPGLQVAVINFDDQFADTICACLDASVMVIPVSSKGHQYALRSGLAADNIVTTATGVVFDLHYKGESEQMRSRLLGRFNVDNLLSAAGVLVAMGHSLQQSILLLSKVPPVPGRMQLLSAQNMPAVVIDYAHTPDALEQALRACRQHTQGQLWCVFGCGGDRDQGKRAQMGHVACDYADHLVITNDNPRGEAPGLIVEQILEGVTDLSKALVEPDRARAIAVAIAQADIGDLVLIAGKGHENEQIIADQRMHFSDLEQATHCLMGVGA